MLLLRDWKSEERALGCGVRRVAVLVNVNARRVNAKLINWLRAQVAAGDVYVSADEREAREAARVLAAGLQWRIRVFPGGGAAHGAAALRRVASGAAHRQRGRAGRAAGRSGRAHRGGGDDPPGRRHHRRVLDGVALFERAALL